MKISSIIVAAGLGTRAQLNVNKMLFNIDGQTVIEKTVRQFLAVEEISEIIVATNKNCFDETIKLLSPYARVRVVLGGKSRTESVINALSGATGDITLIHDGARPYVSCDLIRRVIKGVSKNRSAIAVIPSVDTLCEVQNEQIVSTMREGYYRVQTPQGFYTTDIKLAYSKIPEGKIFLDDSSVYSAIIGNSYIVDGESANIKLTNFSDFQKKPKVGCGFDIHRLVEDRSLILGGIKIPHYKGLLGHSDADVLTHAIMDAMLSACALRDIGYHFPDSEIQYEGISSIILLEKVIELIQKQGYRLSNLSASIMAEKPKLMQHIPKISANLAKVINISTNDVGITCTTMEGLGLIGEEEAIAVTAYCMLISL